MVTLETFTIAVTEAQKKFLFPYVDIILYCHDVTFGFHIYLSKETESASTTSFCGQASVLLLEERMCVLLPPPLKRHWGGVSVTMFA